MIFVIPKAAELRSMVPKFALLPILFRIIHPTGWVPLGLLRPAAEHRECVSMLPSASCSNQKKCRSKNLGIVCAGFITFGMRFCLQSMISYATFSVAFAFHNSYVQFPSCIGWLWYRSLRLQGACFAKSTRNGHDSHLCVPSIGALSPRIKNYFPLYLAQTRPSNRQTIQLAAYQCTRPLEPTCPRLNEEGFLKCPMAFAFDIDGVLARSDAAVEGAKDAIEEVQRARIPFILLTNGGGVTEEKKAEAVSKILGLSSPLEADNIQMSHTPMSSLVTEYGNKCVMVVGSKNVLDVAKEYGFKNIISPSQFHRLHPESYPYRSPTGPLPTEKKETQPEAVLVFHDPIDWHMELQILLDVLIPERHLQREQDAGHLLNTPEKLQYVGNGNVQYYDSNPDLVFSSSHPLPRLAQGAFTQSLKAVYKAVYGEELGVNYFGKPNSVAYQHAEYLLSKQAAKLAGCIQKGMTPPHVKYGHIYGIGDNPKSDIRGANRAGGKWKSVLVRTGIFRGAQNDFQDPAKLVFDNVKQAIDHIMSQERRTTNDYNGVDDLSTHI